MNTAHERKSGEVARATMRLAFGDARGGVVRSCGVSCWPISGDLTRGARVIVGQVTAEITSVRLGRYTKATESTDCHLC